MPGVDSILEGGGVFMCDKVWKDYCKRGVYNQQWIHPAGDVMGVGVGLLVTEGGRLCRTCSQEGAEFTCHSVLLRPASLVFVVAFCFMQS